MPVATVAARNTRVGEYDNLGTINEVAHDGFACQSKPLKKMRPGSNSNAPISHTPIARA